MALHKPQLLSLTPSQIKERRNFTSKQKCRRQIYSDVTVFRWFPVQAKAINLYDIEMSKMSASMGSRKHVQLQSSLWSKEPRIFARETTIHGKRQFICAHLGRFMDHYWRGSDAQHRHYYELIKSDAPCRLYLGECYIMMPSIKLLR